MDPTAGRRIQQMEHAMYEKPTDTDRNLIDLDALALADFEELRDSALTRARGRVLTDAQAHDLIVALEAFV